MKLLLVEDEAPQMEQLDFGRLVLGGVLPFESVAFEAGRELDCADGRVIFTVCFSNRMFHSLIPVDL